MKALLFLLTIPALLLAQVSSVTTIQGTDTIRDSRTVLNSNFNSLHTNKVNGAPNLTTPQAIMRVLTSGQAGETPVVYDPTTQRILGAGLNFLQSGANAVNRSVESKLREFPSVKDFGAVCDGTTDDSLAFTRGITAVGAGGTLRVPAASCNTATTGITIPLALVGVQLVGESNGSSKIIYSGSGAAITIGDATGITVGHTIQNIQIDITNAGANAMCVKVFPSLYVTLDHVYATSATAISVGSNNQIGIQAAGGNNTNQFFVGYLTIKEPRISGKFKKGIHFKGDHPTWGVTSFVIQGGAVAYSSSPVSNTYGIHVEQGSGLVSLTSVEQFAEGIRIESLENVLVSSRTKSNTLGVRMIVSGGGTSGGGSTKIIGGNHADGITDDTNSMQLLSTITASSTQTRLNGTIEVDNTVLVRGNTAISWEAAAGGNSGIFWKNGTMGNVAGLYYNGSSLIALQNGVNVLTINSTGVTSPVAQTISGNTGLTFDHPTGGANVGITFKTGASSALSGFLVDNGAQVSMQGGTGSVNRSIHINAAHASASIKLQHGGTDMMTVNSTGVVMNGNLFPKTVNFAGLGSPVENAVMFCTNCARTSPCTTGGSGALVKGEGGAWNCGQDKWGEVSLGAQSAAITNTTLLATSHPAGTYRVCVVLATTVAGTSTADITVNYDGLASTINRTLMDDFDVSVLDDYSICTGLRSAGTAAIRLSTTFAGTIPTYNFYATVERLQ